MGKYNNYWYWDHIIEKYDPDNPFEGKDITRESVFFHGVIVNCYGGWYDQWIHFPTVKAMLGYINYIFVSTAFYMFLTEDINIVIPNIKLGKMLNLMYGANICKHGELLPDMWGNRNKVKKLWEYDSDVMFDKIRDFSEIYNDLWNKQIVRFSYFDIYNTPFELGKSIIDAYDDWDLKMIEDQLGVTKDEWLNICKNIFNNEFMKRKFTQILNNRIEDMI